MSIAVSQLLQIAGERTFFADSHLLEESQAARIASMGVLERQPAPTLRRRLEVGLSGAMMSIDREIELSNETLVLRPFVRDDAPALYDVVRESMTDLGRWLSWCHPGYSIEDSLQFLASQGEAQRKENEYGFAIADRSNGQLMGACGINQFDQASMRANLGYWVRTSATGRGVAVQATQLVARWAFETLKLQRIEIVAAAGNHASQRVAEKVGATRECVARHRLRVHGVPNDAVVFSLLPSDLLGS